MSFEFHDRGFTNEDACLTKHFMIIAKAKAWVLMSVVSVLSVVVSAQHSHGPSEYESATAFSEMPSPPVMTRIGTASIRVTTKSAEAQRYFDQGFDLVFGFNHRRTRR